MHRDLLRVVYRFLSRDGAGTSPPTDHRVSRLTGATDSILPKVREVFEIARHSDSYEHFETAVTRLGDSPKVDNAFVRMAQDRSELTDP